MRWAQSSKPLLGGLSFFGAFMLASIIGIIYKDVSKPDIVLMISGAAGFLLGCLDDTITMRACWKFFFQFTIANFIFFNGVQIEVTPVAIFNYIVTISWIVGLMNSINMIDNMDGIAATICIFILAAAISISFFYYRNSHTLIIFLCIAVLIALCVFMKFNYSPAQLFMGDAGSQFLGAVLSVISILFFWQFRDIDARGLQIKQWIVPLVLFIVPLTDTATVVFRRTLRGQRFWIGGRDHTTHYIAYMGCSDAQVNVIIALLSAISFIISLIIIYLFSNNEWKYYYSFLVFIYLMLLFISMQAVITRVEYINSKKTT